MQPLRTPDFENERRFCLDTAWSQVRLQGEYARALGDKAKEPNEYGLRGALWRLMVGSHSAVKAHPSDSGGAP